MLTESFSVHTIYPAMGEYRTTTPLAAGTSTPVFPASSPDVSGPIEYPQELSTTVPAGFRPMLPVSGSKLAIAIPPAKHGPAEPPITDSGAL